MVIDTSALAAILQDEPERRRFNEAIEAAAHRRISTATLVEIGIVIEARYGADGVRDLDLFLAEASIEPIAVDAKQAQTAREAFRRFGKKGKMGTDHYSFARPDNITRSLYFASDRRVVLIGIGIGIDWHSVRCRFRERPRRASPVRRRVRNLTHLRAFEAREQFSSIRADTNCVASNGATGRSPLRPATIARQPAPPATIGGCARADAPVMMSSQSPSAQRGKMGPDHY
jgi:uncharacterized protein with PIN domain